MRIRNLAKHHIDAIAPGAEGEIADNNANRALISAGLVEPMDRLPASPPAKVRAASGGPSDGEVREMVEELNHLERASREKSGRIADLEAECDQLRAKVADLEAGASKGTKELRAELAAARAELASLKAPAGQG